MKKVIIIAIAAALVLVSLNFHFILFDKDFKVLKKAEMNFDNIFVDARGAKKLKLITNPALLSAGIKQYID